MSITWMDGVAYQSLGCITTKERFARLARDCVEVIAKRLVSTHSTDAVFLGVATRCRCNLLSTCEHLVCCHANTTAAAKIPSCCGSRRRVGRCRQVRWWARWWRRWRCAIGRPVIVTAVAHVWIAVTAFVWRLHVVRQWSRSETSWVWFSETWGNSALAFHSSRGQLGHTQTNAYTQYSNTVLTDTGSRLWG